MSLRDALVTSSVGLLFAFAVPGCSDNDDTSATKFVQDYCALLSSCCVAWGAQDDGGAQCRQLMSWSTTGGSVDKSDAEACIARMRQEQADGTLCEGKPATTSEVDPCDKVFGNTTDDDDKGTTPAGGKCQTSDDCAAPAGGMALCNSLSTDSGFDHYCQAVKAGKEGDGPCTVDIWEAGGSISYGSNEKLLETISCAKADGLWCDYSGTKMCKALSADGSPCTVSSQCAGASFCGNGVCTPDRTEGQECDKYQTPCASGLYCEEATKLCVKLKHLGDACTEASECTGAECKDGKCGAGLASMAGIFVCKQ